MAKAMTEAEVLAEMGVADMVERTDEEIAQELADFDKELNEIENAPADMTLREKLEDFFGKDLVDQMDDEQVVEHHAMLTENM